MHLMVVVLYYMYYHPNVLSTYQGLLDVDGTVLQFQVSIWESESRRRIEITDYKAPQVYLYV